MFTHTIREEVYGSFIILMTGKRDEIKAAVEKYDSKFDGDMDFVGRCIEVRRGEREHLVIVMLPDWPHGCIKNPYDYSVIVHELFHATEFVMWYHDIDHNVETQEAWAYYLDHLTRRALEILQ